MTRSKAYASIQNSVKAIDWKLLIFLLFFLNVKLAVKLVALLFIYIARPDFKFGFRFKNSRLPLFYLIVIGIAFMNWIIAGPTFNMNYMLVVSTGIVFWAACILAIHQVKMAVEKNDPLVIHNTLFLFFIINAIASYVIYTGIVLETGTINPFRYQGNFQKYFMGTGDYIKGISFDTSTTNAVINAFGVLYFLDRKNAGMTLLCMFTLLLTASNFTNLVLCGVFAWLFIFSSNKNQKSIIVVCLMLIVLFMVKISPQNNRYLQEAYSNYFNNIPRGVNKNVITANFDIRQNENGMISEAERKQKIAKAYIDSMDKVIVQRRLPKLADTTPASVLLMKAEQIIIPPPNIHSDSFQHKNDTTLLQKRLLGFSGQQSSVFPLANQLKPAVKLPGKIIALQQTVRYFQQHPQKIIAGAGIGNFSSKLAFKATAMKVAGGYPAKFAYINPDFESNHFDLYLSFFTRQEKLHSLTNNPHNVYDQLLAEYGLAGITALVFLYFFFFAKHRRKLTYGIPILIFTAAILFADYWFEQLSVIILFELLLLLNIKETGMQKIATHVNA